MKTSYSGGKIVGQSNNKMYRKRGLSWWRHEQERQEALLAALTPSPGSLTSTLGRKKRKGGK